MYSFGIVVYRLLTGAFPFEGEDYVELLFKQVNEEAKPPSALNPALPASVDAAVAWMMRKDRTERPATLLEAVNALDPARIAQFHLAGHSNDGGTIIDTHDAPVSDAVFALYGQAVARFGMVPAMIERDDKFPPFADLLAELARLRRIAADQLGTPLAGAAQ